MAAPETATWARGMVGAELRRRYRLDSTGRAATIWLSENRSSPTFRPLEGRRVWTDDPVGSYRFETRGSCGRYALGFSFRGKRRAQVLRAASAGAAISAVRPATQESGVDEGIEHSLASGIAQIPQPACLLAGQSQTGRVGISPKDRVQGRVHIRVCTGTERQDDTPRRTRFARPRSNRRAQRRV